MRGRRWKEYLFIGHRWIGVAVCVFVVLWFASGLVMMYVGYPSPDFRERLAKLAPLDARDAIVPLAFAWKALPADEVPTEVILQKIAGRPIYKFSTRDGVLIVDARTGKLRGRVSEDDALAAAREAVPANRAEYRGAVSEDVWSGRSSLGPHRPLHRFQMDDAAGTLVYVSSATGEVLVVATKAQRRWNYVGAWLHWLYFFYTSAGRAAWRLIVIGLSSTALVLAATGVVIGIMRWRFQGRHRSGSRSPYRNFILRWHHITGMVFGCLTLTWLFSGLMSMNPGGVFTSAKSPLDVASYAGAPFDPRRFRLEAKDLLVTLPVAFAPRLIEWRLIDGVPFLIARSGRDEKHIALASRGSASIAERIPRELLLRAGARLLGGAPMMSVGSLEHYDYFYYRSLRHNLSGDEDRPLPVLKLEFADAARTWIYLDEATGAVVTRSDSSSRLQRGLFLLLHDWDLAFLLGTRPSWDILLVLALMGGAALGITGVVIAIRRVRFKLEAARPS